MGTSDTRLLRREDQAYVLEQRRDGKTRRVSIRGSTSMELLVKQVVSGEVDLAIIEQKHVDSESVQTLLAAAKPGCSVRTIAEPPGDYRLVLEPSPKSAYSLPEAAALRVAIAEALDRQALASFLPPIYRPWARPLADNALGFDPTVRAPEAQPDQAKVRFAEAAPKIPKLRLPLRIGVRHTKEGFAAALENQLAAAGIRAEVVSLSLVNFWPAYENGMVDFAVYNGGNVTWRGERSSDHLLSNFDPPTHIASRSERSTLWAAAEQRFFKAMPVIILGHSTQLSQRAVINCGAVKDPAGPDGKIKLDRLRSPLSLELTPKPKAPTP